LIEGVNMSDNGIPGLSDSTLLDVLGLSSRARVCLRDAKISTIGQLRTQTAATLLRLPRFGKGCLGEVELALARYNIKLASAS
jgi:DNA-directed RNA polymerase alpha subunit